MAQRPTRAEWALDRERAKERRSLLRSFRQRVSMARRGRRAGIAQSRCQSAGVEALTI